MWSTTPSRSPHWDPRHPTRDPNLKPCLMSRTQGLSRGPPYAAGNPPHWPLVLLPVLHGVGPVRAVGPQWGMPRQPKGSQAAVCARRNIRPVARAVGTADDRGACRCGLRQLIKARLLHLAAGGLAAARAPHVACGGRGQPPVQRRDQTRRPPQVSPRACIVRRCCTKKDSCTVRCRYRGVLSARVLWARDPPCCQVSLVQVMAVGL